MRTLFGAAAATALLLASPAFAQGFGQERYLNLGYTNFALDEINGQAVGDLDFNLGAVTGRLGSKLNTNFGVEAELGVGVREQEESLGPILVSTKLNYAAAAFVVGFLPVTPRTELFARAGVGIRELEAEVTLEAGKEDKPPAEMFAGVGYECDYKDRYISGGRINLALECEREALEGKVMVSIQGTYKGDSFEGTATATSFLPGDGDFVMNSKITGRRTGPTCAPSGSGEGNGQTPSNGSETAPQRVGKSGSRGG